MPICLYLCLFTTYAYAPPKSYFFTELPCMRYEGAPLQKHVFYCDRYDSTVKSSQRAIPFSGHVALTNLLTLLTFTNITNAEILSVCPSVRMPPPYYADMPIPMPIYHLCLHPSKILFFTELPCMHYEGAPLQKHVFYCNRYDSTVKSSQRAIPFSGHVALYLYTCI